MVQGHAKILDIGCGAGTFLLLVAEFCSPERIGGIETSQSLVALAEVSLDRHANEIGIQVEAFDGERFPEWVNGYDQVFLIDVLHHISREKQREFLERLFDALKPGAELVIKDIDAGSRFWCLFNKLHDLIISHELPQEMTSDGLAAVISDIGFSLRSIIKNRRYVYPHFTVRCTKV